jgi:regulation of enolase protein 1 (concanavalin A-like superfamily)
MIRENTESVTKSTSILVASRDQNIAWLNRIGPKGSPNQEILSKGLSLPNIWLRLERSGDQITAKFSEDGVTWETSDQETIEFSPKVIVGLISTSGSPTDLTTATFSDVVVEP